MAFLLDRPGRAGGEKAAVIPMKPVTTVVHIDRLRRLRKEKKKGRRLEAAERG